MDIKSQYSNLYNVSISYKKADTQVRSQFSVTKQNQLALLEQAKAKGIEGVFVLSTCNRTEIMGFAEHPFELIDLLCKYSDGSVEDFSKVSNIYKNQQAIDHLFSVGTGLDSQILGDYEIVGQLRQAFKQAKASQTTNSYLDRLLSCVIQASKQIKNETQLSSGTTSVSYAAVQYIIKNLPDYNSKNILVFGIGKMGKNTCKNLSSYTDNNRVCLINRTEGKSEEILKMYPSFRSEKIENLSKEIAKTDILILSTSADTPTIRKEHIPADRKILILDLSMPTNVSNQVQNLKNVTLVNVDKLSKITEGTSATRKQEVPKAKEIIELHKSEFNQWENHRKFVPAINTLKQSLQTIQKDEISFYRKKITDFDENQAEIITSKMIQKITTQFVKHLKDKNTSVNQSIQVMTEVFGGILEKANATDY